MLNSEFKNIKDIENNDTLEYNDGVEKEEGKYVLGLNDKSKEENKKEDLNNINNNDPLALYQKDMKIEEAFEKHDRILRTPPGEYK